MSDQQKNGQVVAGINQVDGTVMRLTQGGRLLPYIVDSVYMNFGQNYFTTFAEHFMDKRYTSSQDIYHIEEHQQIYTIKITTDKQAIQPGGEVTLNYANNIAGGLINIQPGYFVGIPPLGKIGRINSVDTNAKTFKVQPNDKEYRINVYAGNELIIIPAAIVAACSDTFIPSGKKLPGFLYKSKKMIIKKNLRICGSDLAQWLENRTLFPLKSLEDPCEDINVWWHGDLEQMWMEFTQAKQMFGMLGEDITNNVDNFANLNSTTGTLPALRSRAMQEPVSQSVGINIDYFKRMNKRLKRIRNYCNQYSFWFGSELRAQADSALDEKVIKNDLSWNFLDGDKERGIRFGFDAVKIDNIEYYLHDEGSLNDPGFLGADGFNGPYTGFGVPMCKLACGNDLRTPIVLDYLAGNGVNRELIEDDYGVLRPGSGGKNEDWHEWKLMSEFGLDFYGLNNFFFTEAI